MPVRALRVKIRRAMFPLRYSTRNLALPVPFARSDPHIPLCHSEPFICRYMMGSFI